MRSVKHVGDADGGRARDALHAVHVALAALAPTVGDKLNCVVEDASNVLRNVVLQVVAPVDYAHRLVVVVAVVRSAIDYVRDAATLENFCVARDEVSTQV